MQLTVPSGGTDKNGSNRVNRGGSWNNNAENCAVSNRNSNSPDNRNNNLGFRLVRSAQLALWSGNLAADCKKTSRLPPASAPRSSRSGADHLGEPEDIAWEGLPPGSRIPQIYMARRCW